AAPPPASSSSVERVIPADRGGVVDYGAEEVVLAIPPGSLAADTKIGIARIDELPDGDSDGLDSFGQAYRCSPAGTQFALAHPAQMVVHYDAAALTAKGLDPATVELYYFDEDQHRYYNVPGTVDTTQATVTARIEHFTVYVPFAQTLVAGNH